MSKGEERAVLDSIIELLTRGDFYLTHASIDTCSREVESDIEGQKKYIDTGVKVITLITNAKALRPDSYGAEVSEDVGESPIDRMNEMERLLHQVADMLIESQATSTSEEESLSPIAKGLLEDIWKVLNQ